MITFKPKQYQETDLIQTAIDYLKNEGVDFSLISSKDADSVSKVNSRSMVLNKFFQTTEGKFRIQVQDKECYRYTQKHLQEKFRMKIIEIDTKERKILAETDYLGKALECIELLALKYNLSIVNKK